MKKFKLLVLIMAIVSISCKKENVQIVIPFAKIIVPANSEAIAFTGELSLNTSIKAIGQGSVSSQGNYPIEQTALIKADKAVTVDQAVSRAMIMSIFDLSGNGDLTIVYGYLDAQENPIILATHTLIIQDEHMTMDGQTVYGIVDLNYHAK